MPVSRHIRLIETELNEALEALDDAAEDDATVFDIDEAIRLANNAIRLYDSAMEQLDVHDRQQLQFTFTLRITHLRSRLMKLQKKCRQ